ncbi:MAG: hypothetical protein WC455_11630 [Dehalococcoidia bacterium]|jgi:hypothetical protein
MLSKERIEKMMRILLEKSLEGESQENMLTSMINLNLSTSICSKCICIVDGYCKYPDDMSCTKSVRAELEKLVPEEVEEP